MQTPRICLLAGITLTLPQLALARPLIDPEDPAMEGALVDDLDDLTDVSPTGATLTLGDSRITISVGAEVTDELPLELYSCGVIPDCRLAVSRDYPVTITFDPPVGAFGLDMEYSVGPFSVTVEGALGREEMTHETLGWVSPDGVFAGAADLGPISTVVLATTSDGTFWDNLRIVEDTMAGTGADLALQAFARSRIGPEEPFSIGLTARNAGPFLSEFDIVTLLPPGTAVTSSSPEAELTPNLATFPALLMRPEGESEVSLDLRSPPREVFDCDDSLRTIGIVTGRGTVDPNPLNDVAVVDVAFDPSRGATTEDCETPIDDDCDGLVNCADDDCACGPQLHELAALPFPPLVPWLPAPDPLELLLRLSNPWELPAGPQECVIRDLHGTPMRRPPVCCGPQPRADSVHPSFSQWQLACTPIDPNYKSATPGTNALGIGTTHAGELIEYAITYENIGGVPSYDVVILDVLSPEVDAGTLTIEDEGVYDEQTRTIMWLDDALPPEEPHVVHYSVAVREDAPLGTRVQNTATIVFRDAVPPSRIDTPPIVHVIPDPSADVRPDLRISGCIEEDDGQWRISVVNASLVMAYDATARIIDAPDGIVIDDDECAFAHPDDPAGLAAVLPWATTVALDSVRFSAPEEIEAPCAELTWEIEYWSPGGESIRVESRLQAEPEFDVSTSGAELGGCACRVEGSPRTIPLMLLFLFLGRVGRRTWKV